MNNLILLNTIIPIIAQLATYICGFVLPRAILVAFGSEVNGAVSSVNQFLGIISFLDLGVSAVFQSALYKPLATKDEKALNAIVASADSFFDFVGKVLIVYIIILCVMFPFLSKGEFDDWFWITLILAMGVNSFGQCYLGVVDRIIIVSDRSAYFTASVNAVTIVINTIISLLLIYSGASIQLVKFSTSLIYLGRPIAYRLYVKKKYNIKRNVKYKSEPIKQKWSGAVQHVSTVVMDGTNTVILTIFSTIINVSIYNVYYLVVSAIKSLFLSVTNAITPYIGRLWAEGNKEKVKEIFSYYEWIINATAVIMFGCTASLIVEFVMIYTSGVTDADYFQPAFSFLFVLSTFLFALRIPYWSMINVTGSYRQTQHIYILGMIINIILSIVFVQEFELVGVAMGMMLSLLYQTIHMAIYTYKDIFNILNIYNTLKLWIIDLLIFFFSFALISNFHIDCNTYIDFIVLSIQMLFIWMMISIVAWGVFFPKHIRSLLCSFKLISKN